MEGAGTVDRPAADLQRDKASSDHESHREEAQNSMNCLAPLPLVAQVAVRVDLAEAYERPGRPHEDAMRVVLRVVVHRLNRQLAGPSR